MSMDSLHGAIFILELLTVLNSIVLIVLLSSSLYQIKVLTQTCEQLKNWLVVQNRKMQRVDKP